MSTEDILDLVNDQDQVIGQGKRSECHGDPALIHRAVHVLIFNYRGELLLQLRSKSKKIQPGKWDSSVGGHVDCGEDYVDAARREMGEELGITRLPLTFLYASKIRNRIESENIQSFLGIYDGQLRFAQDEIDEVRFWTAEEIDSALGRGCFTPNFEEEWGMFNLWCRRSLNSDPRLGLSGGASFPDLIRQL